MGAEPRPESGTVADLIERAFRYRGDVTLELTDSESVTGYLFNRNTRCSEPFVQMFETSSGRELSVPFQCIAQIRLTGRDAAAASASRLEESQRQ